MTMMTEPMLSYPLDAESRAAIREKHVMRAMKQALHVGWSMRCGYGDHRRRSDNDETGWTGCRNDGTGCLCPCHER